MCDTHYRQARTTGSPYPRPEGHFFWKKVARGADDECWEWRGAMSSTGYGVFRGRKAHRVSAEMAGHRIAGAMVLHGCDNKRCVNPAHLSPGDHSRNMREAVDRGRFARGERSGAAKLTESEVREIRQLVGSGPSYAEIARRVGTTKSNVYQIAKGNSWRHLT